MTMDSQKTPAAKKVKPVKGWAIANKYGKIVSATIASESDAWFDAASAINLSKDGILLSPISGEELVAMQKRGYRCTSVLIAPL